MAVAPEGSGGRPAAASPHGDFNLGLGLGEEDAVVLARREGLADWLGVPVVTARQVHGTHVHPVPAAPQDPTEVPTADGLVTTSTEVGLVVLAADCVPVLLCDPHHGVAAAVHAGRAGVVGDVVGRAVAAMVGRGAQVTDLRAVVGPAVCGSCYEVPAELAAQVVAAVPETRSRTRRGTAALDLPAGVGAQLFAAGVRQVCHLGSCTLEDPRWYSHRGVPQGRPAGRHGGVVRLLRAS
ncbi:peptidoglycan editing factor PgeF [Actinotalea sp. BY-33]|uniref:Purine nucleoside phosphorylase n=2 Tax=Actinotalea soli TaxID=2819234 RepID=A0A939LSV2_9CELL|nr:peptidoglycan editing factor PgeF [Actinotalea soli]